MMISLVLIRHFGVKWGFVIYIVEETQWKPVKVNYLAFFV